MTNLPSPQILVPPSGDVTGPASSTDNAIPRFDGAGGKTLQNSGVTISDANNLNLPSHMVQASDVAYQLGGSGELRLIAETADANARHAYFVLPDGSSVLVPVIAMANLTGFNYTDSGLFDGLTQPTFAVIDKSHKYTSGSAATSSGADTTLTEASKFGSAAVGDIVRVTAGTNATAGWYWIDAVTDAGNIVLDRNWCTGAVTGGTYVIYHSFTLLTAEGVCTRTTDGAPSDTSVEMDRDGWIIVDAKNNDLYYRSQAGWKSIKTTKLDDLAAPDDNTDLNFSTAAHGLTPKGTNLGNFLKDDGTWAAPAGGGDVTGPASSVDNAIVRFNGTTGKTIQDYTSGAPTIGDTGVVTFGGDVTVPNLITAGNVDGRDVSVDGTKLDGVEAAADVTDATNVAAAGALMTNVAMTENEAIVLDAALSADGKYSGIVETGTAGVALAFGDLVYLAVADSRWELTDASAAATAIGKIGICVLAAVGDGSATTILLWGKVRADTAFPALTVGAPVHISETAGDVVVAAPSTSSAIVRIIGYGNTADELHFSPDNAYVTVA